MGDRFQPIWLIEFTEIRSQASDLIAGAQANRHLARATPAQIWRLRKSGVPTPEGLTKREASALIDELVRQST